MILPLGSQTIHPYFGIFIFLIGGAIGLLAIGAHKKGNFNILPDIKENCELVTSGIYAYVRHPMYLSVLLMMLGVSIVYFTYYEFALYLILVFILLIKLFYEEGLWKCHSEEYAAYKKHTKRLLPFIF
jgi:protein-S-isoprenylcysteine O-methyltransferase Ste14